MIFLSLGSNVGDRVQNLTAALSMLAEEAAISDIWVSSLYETEPYGVKEQADFLNMAVGLRTSLPPLALLSLCQTIETVRGRQRKLHWGPRTLDIDILLYDDLQLDTDVLKLPHPYLAQRRFVLVPLAEVAGCAGEKAEIASLLAECKDAGAVRKYKSAAELKMLLPQEKIKPEPEH